MVKEVHWITFKLKKYKYVSWSQYASMLELPEFVHFKEKEQIEADTLAYYILGKNYKKISGIIYEKIKEKLYDEII